MPPACAALALVSLHPILLSVWSHLFNDDTSHSLLFSCTLPSFSPHSFYHSTSPNQGTPTDYLSPPCPPLFPSYSTGCLTILHGLWPFNASMCRIDHCRSGFPDSEYLITDLTASSLYDLYMTITSITITRHDHWVESCLSFLLDYFHYFWLIIRFLGCGLFDPTDHVLTLLKSRTHLYARLWTLNSRFSIIDHGFSTGPWFCTSDPNFWILDPGSLILDSRPWTETRLPRNHLSRFLG